MNKSRRGFLKGAAASAAALVSSTPAAAQQSAPQLPAALPPTDAQLAAEAGARLQRARIVERPGSDYMVDVIRALGIEYVAANPGSSFDGIHESIINYGNNKSPELLTCCHEESSVAMAQGYAKIEGKPMMVMLHGTVGLQHGSMAIYNAYADRTPIIMIAGLDYQGSVAAHNAIDMAAMVRDFVKWDDQPKTLNEFAQSAVRAHKLATTAPMAPVLLVVDNAIQKAPQPQNPLAIPRINPPAHPSADIGSVREIARLLVSAENPRINAGRVARTQRGIDLLVELAQLLQIPINSTGDRVSFPSRHALAGTGVGGAADFILNLESTTRATGKTASITSAEFLATHNFNINAAGGGNADLSVAADAEASLPALIEEVKKLITADRQRVFQERGGKHAEANRKAREQVIESARYGWDSSPISVARLSAELWPLIKNDDWSLVSGQTFLSNWPSRLWNMDKLYRCTGSSGGAGIGYNLPAAVGGALANKKYGRLSVNIQGDGDLNYAPGVLWTAVHHKIPLLTVMHNNRAYHAEVMIVQECANQRNRGVDKAHIGTTLREPFIDYSKMAQAYGMYAEGPISDPKDLAPALRRGLERVKRGEPALIDVLTQPR